MDVPLWIAASIGVACGIVGYLVSSLRFVRLERARRASREAAVGIARIGLETLPVRSVADILSGRIQVVLGGVPYIMQVLPRRAQREWAEKLDERWGVVIAGLEQAGNDTPKILQLLSGHTDYMLDMLRLYDVDNVLPDNEFIDLYATDGEIIAATVEIWRAANPLAAIGAEAAAETMAGMEPAQQNWPPPSTDGAWGTSTTT